MAMTDSRPPASGPRRDQFWGSRTQMGEDRLTEIGLNIMTSDVTANVSPSAVSRYIGVRRYPPK